MSQALNIPASKVRDAASNVIYCGEWVVSHWLTAIELEEQRLKAAKLSSGEVQYYVEKCESYEYQRNEYWRSMRRSAFVVLAASRAWGIPCPAIQTLVPCGHPRNEYLPFVCGVEVEQPPDFEPAFAEARKMLYEAELRAAILDNSPLEEPEQSGTCADRAQREGQPDESEAIAPSDVVNSSDPYLRIWEAAHYVAAGLGTCALYWKDAYSNARYRNIKESEKYEQMRDSEWQKIRKNGLTVLQAAWEWKISCDALRRLIALEFLPNVCGVECPESPWDFAPAANEAKQIEIQAESLNLHTRAEAKKLASPPKTKRHAGMTKAEANAEALKHFLKHPDATARQLADAIGCSLGMVCKLPAWKAIQEQLKKGRAPKMAKTLRISDKMNDVVGTEDDALAQLIDDQRADAEPSPLDDDSPGRTDGNPRRAKVYARPHSRRR